MVKPGTFNFAGSVKIRCESHTAFADRDFLCNDTVFEWNATDSDMKEFTFGIYNDIHWEHSETFYISLYAPFNGIIREEHQYITVRIIANDEQSYLSFYFYFW